MKEVYNILLSFLENSEIADKDFDILIEQIEKGKYNENREEFQYFLRLLLKISNNHHRYTNFNQKIEQILQYYETKIKQTFSNYEIFNFFKSNKKILLFLFDKKMLNVDDSINQELIDIRESNCKRYCHFFYPEIKQFINNEEKITKLKKSLLSKNSNILFNFEENRHQGENDSPICTLIRNDSIEEFITYVNQTNMSLFSKIKPSIFETNSFLIENKPSLIEYTTFFGSIQIFNYLKNNNVELTDSLWLYVIHSQNSELFQILEFNNIKPPNDSFVKCFIESIKCHHNDMANYIKENFLYFKKETKINNEIIQFVYSFNNYTYFPSDFKEIDFFYLNLYNYSTLVNLYIKMKETNIIETIQKSKVHNFF